MVKRESIKNINSGLEVPNSKKTPDVIGRYLKSQMVKDTKKVIFLFDSLNYFEFKKHFNNRINLRNLKCFNSNFPTGTYTAYPSIFFGVKPDKHKLLGTAFYSRKDKGLFSLMSDRVTGLNGQKIKNKRYKKSGKIHSFLEYSKSDPVFLSLALPWLSSSLWDEILGESLRIKIPLIGPEDNRNYKEELRTFQKGGKSNRRRGPSVLCVFVDFDEIMHIFGVKNNKTQKLLEMSSILISEIINKNPSYDYLFVSDHGQIDQKNTKKLNLEKIKNLIYCEAGGVGRARYIYSKSDAAFLDIKKQVGSSGVVFRRTDKELKKLFGFDPSHFDEIGDIVAIATKPSFPSHGWNWKAEHGGLSRDEINIPFLHIKANR